MEVTKKAKRDKKNPKGSQNTKSKTYQASTSGEACETCCASRIRILLET